MSIEQKSTSLAAATTALLGALAQFSASQSLASVSFASNNDSKLDRMRITLDTDLVAVFKQNLDSIGLHLHGSADNSKAVVRMNGIVSRYSCFEEILKHIDDPLLKKQGYKILDAACDKLHDIRTLKTMKEFFDESCQLKHVNDQIKGKDRAAFEANLKLSRELLNGYAALNEELESFRSKLRSDSRYPGLADNTGLDEIGIVNPTDE